MGINQTAREFVPHYTQDPEFVAMKRRFRSLVRSIETAQIKAGLRRKRVSRGTNTSARTTRSEIEG